MIIEIKETKARSTCGGLYSDCRTYQDHPDAPNLYVTEPHFKYSVKTRHIPKGETAFFFDMGDGKKFCMCKVHGTEFLQDIEKQVQDAKAKAKELGWIQK